MALKVRTKPGNQLEILYPIILVDTVASAIYQFPIKLNCVLPADKWYFVRKIHFQFQSIFFSANLNTQTDQHIWILQLAIGLIAPRVTSSIHFLPAQSKLKTFSIVTIKMDISSIRSIYGESLTFSRFKKVFLISRQSRHKKGKPD